MAPCKLKLSWLDEEDVNGHLIKTWAQIRHKDNKNIYCSACEKIVCIQKGICAIQQHARGISHKEKFNIKFNSKQLHLNGSNNNNVTLINGRQQATREELLWTLRIINKNQTFQSADGLKDFLNTLYSDSTSMAHFSLGQKKLSYYVTHALAPYFLNQLTNDICGKIYHSLFCLNLQC